MIYTRMGVRVKVIAYAGVHSIKRDGERLPVHLVQVEDVLPAIPGDSWQRWRLAEMLKADNGWPEVEQAFTAAPYRELSVKESKSALREAGG